MRQRLGILLLLLLMIVARHTARASDIFEREANSWDDFSEFVELRAQQDRAVGLGYMIGGGVAGVIGVVGYQNAQDVMSRSIFAISQSAGIIALGYGASLYWGGNEYTSFYAAVNESSLSEFQKLELLRAFLKKEHESREITKWIRVSTLVLASAVNFYAASQEPDPYVQRAFQLLGVLNLGLAIQISF